MNKSRRARFLPLAAFFFAAQVFAHGGQVQDLAAQSPPASDPTVALSGYVTELVVDNRVAGTVTRYPVLVADDGQRLVLKDPAAAALATGSGVAVAGRVLNQSLFVTSAQTTAARDARYDAARKPTRDYSGTLELAHWDNFDGGPSGYIYSVAGAGGSVNLLLGTALPELARGSQVTVTGQLEADEFVFAERIVILAPPPPDAKSRVTPKIGPFTNQVLVIPVKFPTNTTAPYTYGADPWTIAQLTSTVFTGTTNVADFYREGSFNQQMLAGVVAHDGANGFLQVPQPTPTPVSCNYLWIETQAKAAAQARGYNLGSYQNLVYVFQGTGFNCGWAGLAYISQGRAWVKANNLLVFGHELGHNFGLYHAGSVDCGAEVLGGTCTVSDYGDPFGIMGNSRAMHFSAMQKADLQWIAASTVKTHTTGSATYTLTPLETAGGTSYAVKVPAAPARTYWIEYRQPIGYDAALGSFPNNGAQFRVAAPFEYTCGSCADDTEFLDMTPATSAFTDGTLVVGQSYTDALYGLRVDVVSATASALTVNVTMLAGTPPPDLNASGTSDLLWRNATSGTAVWLMNGVAATGASLVMPDPNWSATRIGDLNGDGKSDLVWRNTSTGQSVLWLMNGLGATAVTSVMTDPNWTITHTGDFSGDGKSDLVWRNGATGQTAIWLMSGTTAFGASLVMSDPNWSVVRVGDFNGDGKADLVWRNGSTGQTAIWLMNGLGATAAAVINSDPNWTVARLADFNGDGKADIVWRTAAGQTVIWLMNGTGATGTSVVMADPNWTLALTGDFNADGKADALWRNSSTGATAVWLMNGLASTSSATLMTNLAWSVTHVGDFNGDTKDDLVWRNSSTGATAVWLMNGTASTTQQTLMTDPNWSVATPAQ